METTTTTTAWTTRPAPVARSTAPEIGPNYPTGFWLLLAFAGGMIAHKVL
jgi:hypothetical protein